MQRYLRKLASVEGINSRFFGSTCVKNGDRKFVYSEEILAAKHKGEPIVALESTIITHGLPYPDNYEIAVELEDIIRKKVNNVSIVFYRHSLEN